MTKNVGIELAIKNMTAMGIRFEQGRLDATAKLPVIEWSKWEEFGNGIWRRHSVEARRELVSPNGEEGCGGPKKGHGFWRHS